MATVSNWLTAAALMLPVLASGKEIYKCQDLNGKSIIFSSSPCDPDSQRTIGVLTQQNLDERLSTFDGASLRRKHEALERKRAQQAPPPDAGRAASEALAQTAAPATAGDPCPDFVRKKAALHERMRQGYSETQGDYFRELLRKLDAGLDEHRCAAAVVQAAP